MQVGSAMTEVGSVHQLRVAVVGCGPVGQLHAQGVLACATAKLACVCDIRQDRAATLSQRFGVPAYTSLTQLLEQQSLDLITIATPDHLHASICTDALKANCHVF